MEVDGDIRDGYFFEIVLEIGMFKVWEDGNDLVGGVKSCD